MPVNGVLKSLLPFIAPAMEIFFIVFPVMVDNAVPAVSIWIGYTLVLETPVTVYVPLFIGSDPPMILPVMMAGDATLIAA